VNGDSKSLPARKQHQRYHAIIVIISDDDSEDEVQHNGNSPFSPPVCRFNMFAL
jgi:hypothetical protein